MDDLPLNRPLSGVRLDHNWLVVVDGDRDDWLVSLEDGPNFDAAHWANQMVTIFNDRLARQEQSAPQSTTGRQDPEEK